MSRSLIASPLFTIYFSILARHSCVQPNFHRSLGILQYVRTCPKCSVACTLFSYVVRLLTLLFIGLLIPAACSLLSHSTDCQNTDSRIGNPKHYHLQGVSHSVSSLHLLASTAGIHRRGQACRQKLLASTSCSIWLHPLNVFTPSTLLQTPQLLQCSPCPR